MGKNITVDTRATTDALVALGLHVRLLRKKHNLTSIDLAKAANISRVTLHRIEKGEPSVTAGAYATVLHALGEGLGVNKITDSQSLPEKIAIAKYPQLKNLSWQLKADSQLTQREAWDIYSRNWRHLDTQQLAEEEAALIAGLKKKFEDAAHV